MNRCSTGTDRRRQQWIQSGCEKNHLKDTKTCPALGAKGNNYAKEQPVDGPTNKNVSEISNPENCGGLENETKSPLELKKTRIDNEQPKHSHASFALGILLPIAVIASLVMWVFYAYRNPHTKSGQLLIQVSFISLQFIFSAHTQFIACYFQLIMLIRKIEMFIFEIQFGKFFVLIFVVQFQISLTLFDNTFVFFFFSSFCLFSNVFILIEKIATYSKNV